MAGKIINETTCPIDYAFRRIGGKYKGRALWALHNREILRYGELRKLLSDITPKMLTQTLRIEADMARKPEGIPGSAAKSGIQAHQNRKEPDALHRPPERLGCTADEKRKAKNDALKHEQDISFLLP